MLHGVGTTLCYIASPGEQFPVASSSGSVPPPFMVLASRRGDTIEPGRATHLTWVQAAPRAAARSADSRYVNGRQMRYGFS
jgi:hypothetical protein